MKQLQRVSYIDDDADIRSIVRVALEMVGGLDVEMFSSGKEALSDAESLTTDIIMLDVMMPEMDGCETLRQLRKIPKIENVPAIFITAKIGLDDMNAYYKHDIAGIIQKPFDPMTLADQVREIWYSAVSGRNA